MENRKDPKTRKNGTPNEKFVALSDEQLEQVTGGSGSQQDKEQQDKEQQESTTWIPSRG